jgi:hypothetical protein
MVKIFPNSTPVLSQTAATAAGVYVMLPHGLHHVLHAAAHDKKNPKLAGVVLIFIGLFLTPWLIGIPIVIYGICKLAK